MIVARQSVVLGSGYRCFALFGAAPPGRQEGAGTSTLWSWLESPDLDPHLLVSTGSQFGPFDVTVLALDERPEPSRGEWEDVAEVSFVADGEIVLGDLEDGPLEEGVRLAPGAAYRLRISAAGRTEADRREQAFPDEDDDRDDDVPLERYLLEVWPADVAAPRVLREDSEYARQVLDPPAPDHPAEREPGLEAARRIAADLRGEPGARRLTGRLAQATTSSTLASTPVKLFNRLRFASGWPPGNGGSVSDFERVGDQGRFYAHPPDAGGTGPLLGMIETEVIELDRPGRLVLSWNWRVAGPDGRPFPTNPLLLAEDSTVALSFDRLDDAADGPRTRVGVRLLGVPAEWTEDLARLWDWEVAERARL